MTFDWSTVANQGVAAAMFVLFITGLIRGYWVLGRELAAAHEALERMREDRDFWREQWMQVHDTANTAIHLAERPARSQKPPTRGLQHGDR